jgi:type IX secretion system PorP/SprF family membrane protein
MKKFLYTIIAFAFVSNIANAQQLPLSNLYNQNRMMLNPANTGDLGYFHGQIHHRSQWLGIQGAPTSQVANMSSPITDKIAVGGILINQQAGLMRKTSFNGTYAYSLKIDDLQGITFGLATGFYQTSLDLGKALVDDPSEYGMMAGEVNASSFNVDFGVRYQYDKLQVGLAVPQLLQNRASRIHIEDSPFNQFRTHINGYASYEFEVSDFVITPMAITRIIPNASYVVEGFANVKWNDIIWLGLGYRTNANYIVSVGTWLTKNVAVNYAYDFSTNIMGTQSFGSHEIAIGFHLNDGSGLRQHPFMRLNLRSSEELDDSDAVNARKEKAIKRELSKSAKADEKAKKEAALKSSSKGQQKITIITDGYKSTESNPEIKFSISPGTGDVKTSTSDKEKMEKEMEEIKKRLDDLIKQKDVNAQSAEQELGQIAIKLNDLLEKNSPENVQAVSSELEEIKMRIQILKQKIDKNKNR